MATAKVLHYDSRELETFLPHSQPAYISSASTTPNYYYGSYEANLRQYLLAATSTPRRYGTVYDRYVPVAKFSYIRY
jgi:hypothetical protein